MTWGVDLLLRAKAILKLATKADVTAAVASLVDAAPGTLDTLNELAAALADDPNFATTITNALALKANAANAALTGATTAGTLTTSGSVGVGSADPGWGLGFSINVGVAGGASLQGQAGTIRLTSNSYFNGASWVRTTANATSMYVQTNGLHVWYTNPTGAAAGTFTPNDVMRLDPDGNLIPTIQSAIPSLTINQQMVFNLTSDTNLRVSVRGTDGVTRVNNITLA